MKRTIHTIRETVTRSLYEGAEDAVSEEEFHQRLLRIKRALCTAIQAVDNYAWHHEYAIEEQLTADFSELQSWTREQLPEVLGIVVAEIASEFVTIKGCHEVGECYCSQSASASCSN